jgi:transglutaminase-like putative cysteine protease
MSGAVSYRVRHETVYSYGGDVAHSHQLLHLSPRNALRQTCHACTITLMPLPTIRRDDIDAFGNHVTRLEYDLPHDRLEVLAETGVEVRTAPATEPDESEEWEAVSGSLAFSGRPMLSDLLDACKYRMESSYIRIKQTFSDYAADCFLPKRRGARVDAQNPPGI